MKTRIITGVILIAVILPCVFIGQIPFQILIGIIAGAAVLKCYQSVIAQKLIYIYIHWLVFLFITLYFLKVLY